MTTLQDVADYMKRFKYDQVSIGLHSTNGGFVILRSGRERIPTAIAGLAPDVEEAWADLMSKEGSAPAAIEDAVVIPDDDDLDLTLDGDETPDNDPLADLLS